MAKNSSRTKTPKVRNVNSPAVRPTVVGNPSADKSQNNGTLRVQTATFRGPLPPPDILRGYDDICPGAAERIIATYESEVSHRHEMERSLVQADIAVQVTIPGQVRLGQVFAFLICIGFLACGTLLIYNGHEVSGTIFGGSGLVGIVSAFLYTRTGGSSQGSDTSEDASPEKE